MGATRDVLLPDIGDFENVDVAEVLVKVGDRVNAEQSLIVLESDKASMEIPAPFGGVVQEMKVAVGDKISQGALIARIEVEAAEQPAEPAAKPAREQTAAEKPAAPAPKPAPAARPPAPTQTAPPARTAEA